VSVIVHVRFSTMLFLRIDVRDMHVLNRWVIVLMRMSGQQMHPVLSLMEVMSDVIVLVAVLECFVLVVAPRLRHDAYPPLSPASSYRTARRP
jgi:hypothetical protein